MQEFVMDSPVILNNFNFSFSDEEKYFTTNEVLDEIKDLRSRQLAEAGLRQGQLELRAPPEEALQKAVSEAKRLKLDRKLSKADFSVLALAMGIKKPLLTDDIHLQKMCLYLGLEFDSIFRERIEH